MDGTTPSGLTEAINELRNVARQLSVQSQSITNAVPAATTTASPKFTAVALSTATSAVIGTSSVRHGLVMHNPGTSNSYIYAANMTPAPSSSNIAGTVVIYPGGTLSFPSSQMPNINNGFNGFSSTGSNQPFTVIEFF
jgi:hypothetical protein